jgi:hypothetical protein
VITHVIENMRKQFMDNNVSEDVLQKLKMKWEEKLKKKMSSDADQNDSN